MRDPSGRLRLAQEVWVEALAERGRSVTPRRSPPAKELERDRHVEGRVRGEPDLARRPLARELPQLVLAVDGVARAVPCFSAAHKLFITPQLVSLEQPMARTLP